MDKEINIDEIKKSLDDTKKAIKSLEIGLKRIRMGSDSKQFDCDKCGARPNDSCTNGIIFRSRMLNCHDVRKDKGRKWRKAKDKEENDLHREKDRLVGQSHKYYDILDEHAKAKWKEENKLADEKLIQDIKDIKKSEKDMEICIVLHDKNKKLAFEVIKIKNVFIFKPGQILDIKYLEYLKDSPINILITSNNKFLHAHYLRY